MNMCLHWLDRLFFMCLHWLERLFLITNSFCNTKMFFRNFNYAFETYTDTLETRQVDAIFRGNKAKTLARHKGTSSEDSISYISNVPFSLLFNAGCFKEIKKIWHFLNSVWTLLIRKPRVSGPQISQQNI